MSLLLIILLVSPAFGEPYPPPKVRSLPWEDTAQSVQGFVGAEVEIEDECFVWTIRLVVQVNTTKYNSPQQKDGMAGTMVAKSVERAVKPGQEEACLDASLPVTEYGG